MNDPPDCVGGGGTTVFDESGMLPLAERRMSCESAEGGGATTAGAGKFSLALRVAVCSGAETGGGITAGLVICTGEREISRLTPPGAGGITLAASAGVARAPSRATSRLMLGAGATTDGFSEGAVSGRSRETLGAGGITAGARAGATRAWFPEILGAGGINVALRLGAMSG